MAEAQADSYRILVIDDDKSSRESILKIFQSLPHSAVKFPVFTIDPCAEAGEGLTFILKSFIEKKPYALAFVSIDASVKKSTLDTIKQIWQVDPMVHVVLYATQNIAWNDIISIAGARDNFIFMKKPFDEITISQLACALSKKWKMSYQISQDKMMDERRLADHAKALQHSATHDPLTNLPNRILLTDRIYQAMTYAKQHKKLFSLIALGLDRFKLINESLSYWQGDQVLKMIAERLASLTREAGAVYKVSGDEFMIITEYFDKEEQAIFMVERYIKKISEPLLIGDREIHLTACVGVALYPKDGKEVDTLLKNVNTTLTRSKKRGPNHYQFYTTQMNAYSVMQLELENQMRKGIENNEFILHYQPEIDLITYKLAGAEALVRWNHPKRGLLEPEHFIYLAEETGLIVTLGEWILREACKQNKAWQQSGLPPIRISVNVAGLQFEKDNLVETVLQILKETALEPQYLELELTENMLLKHEEIIDKVKALKKEGIQIALDDFGTGYSSLSHLQKIPLDKIKIDKSFIHHIQRSNNQAIVRAIIAMAKSLKLRVVAEGVESKDQLKFLQMQHCKEVQGFYFSKPMSPVAFEQFIREKMKDGTLRS